MKFTILFFRFQDNFFWQISCRNFFKVFKVEKPYFFVRRPKRIRAFRLGRKDLLLLCFFRAFRLRRKDLLLLCFFRVFRLRRKDLLLFCFFLLGLFDSVEKTYCYSLFFYYYDFSFSGHNLRLILRKTISIRNKILESFNSNQQCVWNLPLSTSAFGTSGFQKTIHVFHIRSKNFFVFDQNFMKLCTQIVDTQAYMLHYERKLPAPTVFELLSFKLYKKGGCFTKIHKINENFFFV